MKQAVFEFRNGLFFNILCFFNKQNARKMDKAQIKFELEKITEIVKRLTFDIPKYELAKELNLARVTLDRRLKEHSWTYEEVLIIKILSNKTR